MVLGTEGHAAGTGLSFLACMCALESVTPAPAKVLLSLLTRVLVVPDVDVEVVLIGGGGISVGLGGDVEVLGWDCGPRLPSVCDICWVIAAGWGLATGLLFLVAKASAFLCSFILAYRKIRIRPSLPFYQSKYCRRRVNKSLKHALPYWCVIKISSISLKQWDSKHDHL